MLLTAKDLAAENNAAESDNIYREIQIHAIKTVYNQNTDIGFKEKNAEIKAQLNSIRKLGLSDKNFRQEIIKLNNEIQQIEKLYVLNSELTKSIGRTPAPEELMEAFFAQQTLEVRNKQ